MDDLTRGRTFLVTGANTGIGRVTAEVLARDGGKVILACRSAEKTQPVVDAIRASGGDAEFLELDLADLGSVRTAAASFLARDTPLHVLVNNAGLAGSRGTTKDGFELTFGTNHLGHFLLTMLLLPRLRESAPARIVNVSSASHYSPKTIVWDELRGPTRSKTGYPEYCVSKLCNVLFTKELANGRAGKGVTSYALHPGVIASDVWRQLPSFLRSIATRFMASVEDGAKTTLHCATSKDVAQDDGRYYDKCAERKPSRLSRDAELARELWRRSEEWTKTS